VFSNVLINAAKYTPSPGRIDVSAEAGDGWLVVRIADNGIGIAAEHLPLVFALFAQVESSVGRSDSGQGVGLSLAKSLLDLHGGTIDAFSDGAGKGSVFEIRLPLATSAPRVEPAAIGAASMPAARGRRVLFVDDERDIADSYALLFGERGHLAEVAYDGSGALHVAESFRPDVCVVDLGMPLVDGLELARRIRAAPWGATITLIAHSGWGQDVDRRRSSGAGFDHHVLKPAEPEALFRLVEGG
jgi:CheY-like chemotaxis protein